MTGEAIALFAIGATVLWGGLIGTIVVYIRSEKKASKESK